MPSSCEAAVSSSEKTPASQVHGGSSFLSSTLAQARTVAVPYLQLMRLDRPNGYWYFWFPHVFGTLVVAIEQRSPLTQLLEVNLILLWGVLLMRGASCTWNDTVDMDFDRKVSRCRDRPLARGAVSVAQAHTFTFIQTVLSLATLRFLPPLCLLYSIPAITGWFLYPLTKRITYYPQIVLGFPMAWGVYMGGVSMGGDPLNLGPFMEATSTFRLGHMSFERLPGAIGEIQINRSLAAFYLANVLWTLLYELVYSHQDAAEDEAAGVHNLVLLYMDRNASSPSERYRMMPLLVRIAVGQALCLVVAGAFGGLSFVYSTVAVAGSSAALAATLGRVHLEQPESCAWFFKVGNIRYTGGAILCGLIAEYLFRSTYHS